MKHTYHKAKNRNKFWYSMLKAVFSLIKSVKT